MTLLLNNSEIAELITMPQCIEVLELACFPRWRWLPTSDRHALCARAQAFARSTDDALIENLSDPQSRTTPLVPIDR
jgi:hypothetical protein